MIEKKKRQKRLRRGARPLLSLLLAVAAALAVVGCAKNDVGQGSDVTTVTDALSEYIWQTVETEPPQKGDPAVTADYAAMSSAAQPSQATFTAFTLLCDAIREHRAEISAFDGAEVENCRTLLARTPLTDLVSGAEFNAESGTLSLTYSMEADECARRIAALDEVVSACMAKSTPAVASDAGTALALYRTVASLPFSYDEETSLYECAMAEKYTAGAMNQLYVLLLCGSGLDAVTVGTAESACITAAACIDGAWYHFNPAYESSDNVGSNLWYFGMTDAEANAVTAGAAVVLPALTEQQTPVTDEPSDGEEPVASDTAEPPAEPDDTSEPAEPIEPSAPTVNLTPACDSPRFSALRGCSSWSLDGSDIVIVNDGAEEIRISLAAQ